MDFGTLFELLVGRLIQLAVVLMLFAMGLKLTFKQAFVLWRNPKKLAISLLSSSVLVPVATVLVLYGARALGLSIPLEVQVALLLLSASGGVVLGPMFAQKVGADPGDAISLTVTLSLATVITMPVMVALVVPPEAAISGADVTKTVLSSVLVPMFLGLAIRTWWVQAADIITEPLVGLSGALIKVVVILVILKDLDAILAQGLWMALFVVLTIGIWLVIGHFLGGPRLTDRMTLGIMSLGRNGSVAMLVASGALVGAVPAIVAEEVLNLALILVYVSVIGKKLQQPEEAGDGAVAAAEA